MSDAVLARVLVCFQRNLSSGKHDTSVQRQVGALKMRVPCLIQDHLAPFTFRDPHDLPTLCHAIGQAIPGAPDLASKLAMHQLYVIVGAMREAVENPLGDPLVDKPFDIRGFMKLIILVDTTLVGGPFQALVTQALLMMAQNPRLSLAWKDEDVSNHFQPGVGVLMTNLMVRYLLDEDRSVPARIIEWLLQLDAEAENSGGSRVPQAAQVTYGSNGLEAVTCLAEFMARPQNHQWLYASF